MQEAYAAFQQLLAGLMADAVAASQWEVTASELARLLVAAMRGFKGEARDRHDQDYMIALEVTAVITALTRAQAAS